jgi:hypothetical protein
VNCRNKYFLPEGSWDRGTVQGAAQPPDLLRTDERTTDLRPLKEVTLNMQEKIIYPRVIRTRVKGKLREGRAADRGDWGGGGSK